MSPETETRRVDDKGRITIPTEARDRLNLRPDERVEVDVEEDRLVIRPQISRSTFVDRMAGVVNVETRRESASDLAPDDLKSEWTSDPPNER